MGYLSGAYNYITNAVLGGSANIQSKVGAASSYFFKIGDGSTTQIVTSGKTVEVAASPNTGITCTRADKSIVVGGASLYTATGSIVTSPAVGEVAELTSGSLGEVLTVGASNLYWASNPDTNYYVDSISFTTGDGDLVLGRTSPLTNLTGNLDGRYLTSQYSQAGGAGYVGHFANSTKITGTSDFQYDGTTLTVGGSHVNSVRSVTADTPPVPDLMLDTDYHLHVINIEDPGVAQAVTLPPAVIGKIVTITTYGSTPIHGGTNTITLTPDAGDNINTTLTSTVLSTNGNNNYDVFKFICVAANTWAGAKMEAVS